MKNVKGVNIPVNYLPKFQWVEDIQYFEGALMSEYKTEKGELYVFHWCDCTDTVNRWLAVKTNRRSLYLLTSGLVTMESFFKEHILDSNIYLLDMGANDEIESATLTHIDSIAGEYLPKPDVCVSVDLMPSSYEANYPVLIDQNWSSEELAGFPRKFMDAYALIAKFMSDNIRQVQGAAEAPWLGGASSVSFYQELRGNLGRELGINAVQYASPGYFEFTAKRDISLLLKKNIDAYLNKKDDINAVFNTISAYLKDHKLNKDNTEPNEQEKEWLLENGKKLMDFFNEPTWEWVKEISPDAFRAVKISMSYYRRIRTLSGYVDSKKAVFAKV